jgi:hypothetical protein
MMMAGSVWAKTTQAFDVHARAYKYGNDYLSELRNNWRDNENGITRASGLIVGFAALFEYALSYKVSEVTLLEVKLSDSDVFKFALPVIVAYLYYYVTYAFIESTIFQHAHDAVILKLYPSIYLKGNEREMHPSNSLISSAERVRFSLGPDGLEAGLGTWTGWMRPVFIAVVPFAFLIAAYCQLLEKAKGIPGLLWASIWIAGILLVASVVNLTIFVKILYRRWKGARQK